MKRISEIISEAKRQAAFKQEVIHFTNARTPWGKADVSYKLDRGVTWHGTPGHGGLGVSNNVARSKLSPQARAIGEKKGGAYWFEEDIAYAVPFYENPEWEKTMTKIGGGSSSGRAKLKKLIERWFPQYFQEEFIEKSKIEPFSAKNVQDGDVIFLKRVRPPQFTVHKNLGSKLQVTGADGRNYVISRNSFEDKVYKVLRKGKVIWEKPD